MGNTLRCFLWCFGGEDEGHQGQVAYRFQGGRDRYPYYHAQYYSGDPPAAAPRRPHQLALGPHGVTPAPATVGTAALTQVRPAAAPRRPHQQALGPHGVTPAPATVRTAALTQAAGPNTGHQQRSSGRGVASQYQSNTEDIDESSAEGLCNAMSYAKANPMLIQVPVLGTSKKFWRLSDKAARISRKLALILRSHHSVGKHLAAPLQVSNVWIGSTGSVKLRGVSFTTKGFGIERVREDYKHLSRVLLVIIIISGGDVTKLPPDYKEFLALLGRDTLAMEDEFLIVNNAALLPMKNRTETFLMLHDRIVKYLGRTNPAKYMRILSKLPYKSDWLDTARANAKINQWVVNVQNHEYKKTPYDLLRLNRNVRSHLHDYNDDGIEEVLYCEWPELLMDMVKMLHLEGELEGTYIENKFGAALTQAAGPNTGHQQRSSDRGVASQYQSNTEDIDESSAVGLCNAMSYAKANPMLIQVPVLGTSKKFWRLSDKAARISRKLALILRSHHSVGKHLAAPLQVSNVWIGSTGSVKLRGVSFTTKGFGIERVRDDYKHLSRVLLVIIIISGGDVTKLPPDYKEFLALLGRDTLAMEDEFLIVNNAALLPMKNRTETFLMLHGRIVKYLGRTNQAKYMRILSKLPYESDWLDTARANAKINQWVVNVQNHEYKRTPYDLLRLNRNVRSHLHDFNDDGIEEVLYCEWPELLMDMVKMLHLEGELEGTDIENKFG